jgi:dihydroxyacetone kinase-like protein
MPAVKKIMNDPKNVVPELLEGLAYASHGRIEKLPDINAVVRSHIPEDKVALLIGGGSGHEPLFPGYVGDHLADAAACGPVFAAPSPDTILAATRAIDRGKGVLYLYGNYAGDNMNFDIASELAAVEGIETRTVRVGDDVATDNIGERRGIAGDVLVFKIAGAAAASYDNLDAVHRMTERASKNTRSIGVSVRAGSTPETGEPTFELPADEIEIGMGLHGEPGVSREKLLKSDDLVPRMVELILNDLPFNGGDEAVLLINNLGATTMMELLIANRVTRRVLDSRQVAVYDTLIGTYATTQEMAGFSISLMKLDDELKEFYKLPAKSLSLSIGGGI